MPIKPEISACCNSGIKPEIPFNYPSNHNSHFLPFPSPHYIHSIHSSHSQPSLHPAGSIPSLKGEHYSKQHKIMNREACVEAARHWVNAFLTAPCQARCTAKSNCLNKNGKVFKKATFVKKDSTFMSKKPTVIRQKKRFVSGNVKKTTNCGSQNPFHEAALQNFDDLVIVKSFMYGKTLQDEVNMIAAENTLGQVFAQENLDSCAVLDVPEISDKELEPFLSSEELFFDFNLFA